MEICIRPVQRKFSNKELPKLDYTKEQLDGLALQIIQERTALTGVQPKLSLHMREYAEGKRLTIVGLWGRVYMQTAVCPVRYDARSGGDVPAY